MADWSTRTSSVGAGAVALAWGLIAFAGCGGPDEGERNHRPKRPPITNVRGTIDDRTMSYAGVAIGMKKTKVRAILGPPFERPPTFANLGSVAPNVTPCTASPCGSDLAYGDARISFDRHNRVSAIEVFGWGLATTSGIREDDPLAKVRRVYPQAQCVAERTQGEFEKSASCEARLGPKRYIYVAADKVSLIILSVIPFETAT